MRTSSLLCALLASSGGMTPCEAYPVPRADRRTGRVALPWPDLGDLGSVGRGGPPAPRRRRRRLERVRETDSPGRRGGGEGRRAFVSSAVPASLAALLAPRRALGAYGSSAGMELPNYIEFLIERNRRDDPDAALFKGADREKQLKRILEAASRLGDIPKLAEERKWSQVQGIITGPLGTLLQTMTQVAAGGSPEVQAALKKVKADLVTIGQAAAKKSGGGCIEAAAAASRDLEAFVRLAYN